MVGSNAVLVMLLVEVALFTLGSKEVKAFVPPLLPVAKGWGSTTFVPRVLSVHPIPSPLSSSSLHNNNVGGGSGGGDMNDEEDLEPYPAFDVDSARKQLQSIFTDEKSDGKTTTLSVFDLQAFLDQSSLPDIPTTAKGTAESSSEMSPSLELDKSLLPPLPPLSTIERDVRTAEIQMLEQLAESDSPVPQLWDLWYSQRGGEALGRLRQADKLMADPTTWQDCEDSLKLLVKEYSIYFVEPINRLATLYYLQGRMEASYHLCRLIILHLKPWHFGALAGIVQVCLALGNRDEARYWATKRLPTAVANTGAPPFDGGPTNPRRLTWVQDMVQAAKLMMKEAEETTKQQFGNPEDYYRKPRSNKKEDDDKSDADAWQ